MDSDALHSALISLTLLPEELRSARENISTTSGKQRTVLVDFLATIERDLRLAKATLATELGFPVCQCCWPPELLASDAEGALQCSAHLESGGDATAPAPTLVRTAPTTRRRKQSLGRWRAPSRGDLSFVS